MIANGWRPLTGYENLGAGNLSPPGSLDRSAIHHPVFGKLHEHMNTASEKVKPQTKSPKPQEHSLPNILGSFSVFGHGATKSRAKPKEHHKPLAAASTHYSFLVPPPRDSFRFDVDPHRKAILRDNEAFLRQPSFIPQGHQGDGNGGSFFSKGSGFATSTTHSPGFPKGRPFAVNGGVNGFGVQQNFNPQRTQQFDVHKTSNTKSFLQPPGLENPHNFAPDQNKNLDAGGFSRFHGTPHSAQILNGGGGNFYSQVDHPPQFKSPSYERDPSFLVHESHEISYVTPSSDFNYNFRPSLPFNNLVPPNLFPSTAAPKVEANKFTVSQNGLSAQGLPQILPAGTYYVHGEQRPSSTSWPQQKAKLTTEINEVLPKKNLPAKFRPENAAPDPIFGIQPQINVQPQISFVQPSVQPQFENPIVSGQPQQATSAEPEYETPESISLKHFNEQQFLLQQQLVQQDRQRLQEQELQRQREQQRKQEEENRKQQEEIRILEQREQDEKAKKLQEQHNQRQQEQIDREQQQLQEQFELRKQQEMQERIEQRRQQQQQQQRAQEQLERQKEEKLRQELEQQKKIQEQQFAIEQQEYHRPPTDQERNPQHQNHKPAKENFQFSTVASGTKETPETPRPEVQIQVDPEVRPYRPKFPQRGVSRRRRPTTPGYNNAHPTEASLQDVRTYHSLTDAPVQTTAEPEATVNPVPVTSRVRVRRPGQTLKRRRPYTTTPTPEYESSPSSVMNSSVHETESGTRHQSADAEITRRRRPRPTQSTAASEESGTERHYIRRRPSGLRQRVNPGEPFEAEVVTEIVKPTRIIYKETTEWENYPESFKKKDSQEVETSPVPVQTLPNQDFEQEHISTENSQVFEFSTETLTPEVVTNLEEQQPTRNNAPTQSQVDEETNIPLEQLFDKPEENHVEPFTTPEDVLRVPTTTAIATTTETPTTTEVTASTRNSFRPIRPLKYGNSTRPRFSIKDYRNRLDYKSRLSQLSTTETAPVVAPGRRRFTTEKPEETSAAGAPRETTRGYKYMSRVSYKATTSSPVANHEEGERETTTERQNRFTPKRKLNMNLYRSRVTTTTSQSNRPTYEDGRQSTTRPENIFSSSIRRPRPSYKNRHSEVTPTEEATEMTAEETSFYSSMTTPNHLKDNNEKDLPKEEVNTETESSSLTESVNEVLRREDFGGVEKKVEEPELQISEEKESEVATATPTVGLQENQQDDAAVSYDESIPTVPVWTEPSRDAEDAEISQRIANLTSSSSRLYEPGMFKAVSPATESRVINPHFAIVTDEPTLPIEAFFQVLGKKDE